MQSLLHRFPVIETFSTEEMLATLQRVWGAYGFRVQRRQGKFHALANHWQAGALGITYCAYDDPVEVCFPPSDFVRQQICLEGKAVARAGGREAELVAGAACVVGAQLGIRAQFGAGFRQLVLRIDSDALRRKMAALSGTSITPSLEFATNGDARNPASELLREMVLLVARQLDGCDAPLPAVVIGEMSELMMILLLHSARHRLGQLLEIDPRDVGPWQVRRAEQYIEANWDQPINIESLADITNCSARSLFKTFRRARGMSPMTFVKRTRLEHARRMLTQPDAATTVIGVALACGFQNAGHFARDYRRAFEELPSTTLRRGRGERIL